MVKDHSFTENKFQISGGERTGKWGNHLLQAFFFQIKDDHSVLSYQRNELVSCFSVWSAFREIYETMIYIIRVFRNLIS